MPDEQLSYLRLQRVKSGKYYSNFQYSDAYIYEYLDFERRVNLISNLVAIDSSLDGYKILNKSSFDLHNDSFISEKDFSKYKDSFYFDPESSISIASWEPNKITLSSNLKGPKGKKHFILLSEIFFPYGWFVSNIQNKEIIKANNILRGFFVDNDTKEIVIEFEPFDLKYSSYISIFSLLLIVFIFCLSWHKNERV